MIVLEREQQLGGIPRHTDHLGFGLRDLHRMVSGPAYAARLITQAERLGVDLRPGTTVIDVRGDGVQLATGEHLAADAVVLATGVRERPRAARLVPGDRPAGVYTTGIIQQLTALHHRQVGHRAVIVGAEHVSFSAIWTLRHGGCRPVAMVTSLPRHQTLAPLRWASATRHRVPIITDVEVAGIVGHRRVEAVELSNGRTLPCDTVVFTGDWVPDHELARRAGSAMVPRREEPRTNDRPAHIGCPASSRSATSRTRPRRPTCARSTDTRSPPPWSSGSAPARGPPTYDRSPSSRRWPGRRTRRTA